MLNIVEHTVYFICIFLCYNVNHLLPWLLFAHVPELLRLHGGSIAVSCFTPGPIKVDQRKALRTPCRIANIEEIVGVQILLFAQ